MPRQIAVRIQFHLLSKTAHRTDIAILPGGLNARISHLWESKRELGGKFGFDSYRSKRRTVAWCPPTPSTVVVSNRPLSNYLPMARPHARLALLLVNLT